MPTEIDSIAAAVAPGSSRRKVARWRPAAGRRTARRTAGSRTRTVTAMPPSAVPQRVHEFGAGRPQCRTGRRAGDRGGDPGREAGTLATLYPAAGWTNPLPRRTEAPGCAWDVGRPMGTARARFPCHQGIPYGSSARPRPASTSEVDSGSPCQRRFLKQHTVFAERHGVQEGVVPGPPVMKIASPAARSARPPPRDDDPTRLFGCSAARSHGVERRFSPRLSGRRKIDDSAGMDHFPVMAVTFLVSAASSVRCSGWRIGGGSRAAVV